MEFTHVGSHCSLPSCKQQDFLPFTCDCCHHQYCLTHRSYDAHGCEGGLRKDMTSLDCPICGKSFKFDKSKDPNDMWEEHYSLYCTKTTPSSSSQTAPRCARKDCRNHLGPSNTYQCPKCLKKVCLSHRMSEEHDCIRPAPVAVASTQSKNPSSTKPASSQVRPASNNPREAFLAKVEAKTLSNHSNQRPLSSTAKSTSNKSNIAPAAASRPSPAPSSSTAVPSSSSSSSFLCPMCNAECNSLENLSRHVENHLLSENNNSSNSSSYSSPPVVTSSQSAIERCPICTAEFHDAIALVNHVETVHNNSTSQPANNESNCTLA